MITIEDIEEKAYSLYPDNNIYDKRLHGDNRRLRKAYIQGAKDLLEELKEVIDAGEFIVDKWKDN